MHKDRITALVYKIVRLFLYSENGKFPFGAKKRNGETPISLGVPKMENYVVHSVKTLVIKVHLSFHGPKT